MSRSVFNPKGNARTHYSNNRLRRRLALIMKEREERPTVPSWRRIEMVAIKDELKERGISEE